MPVVLDSLCEPLSWGPLVVLTVSSSCFVLSQYSELDCEQNKLEVRLLDKQ